MLVRVGVEREQHTREVAVNPTRLIVLDSPLSLMCKDCGDVAPCKAPPSTRVEWERADRSFHCQCEVA